ncbi:MAG: hypothetical protein AVDCRST_MAG91-1454 [uncultured Sphingomonadaceae bacterium]|uniref:Uncharacterized protein n=1 Tax=uncultured Sphingomonadaceae bacterium TaxID=169976 RepID=A0A6J4SX22_9SPHN|nr:MAG: hypothetical protein AVDCRST_MAG91-1454 [uncultured Sphingomonadaceae bacterium]
MLFEVGFDLPGRRLELFAVGLLRAFDASPHATTERLVAEMVSKIEDGPVALVAEEPDLRAARLVRSADTVDEAAKLALLEVAERLRAARHPEDGHYGAKGPA